MGVGLQSLALRNRRHPERFPVLRDGPACNDDTLFTEHFRYPTV